MINLNFFTYCSNEYRNFIPIFILSNLFHNKDSFVEICTDSLSDIEISDSLEYLSKLYPDKFLIRKINLVKIKLDNKTYKVIPHTLRFITTPIIKTKYVYISDIDIISLENEICYQHLNHMKVENIPYSNIVRPYTEDREHRRLTGLHFTPYENYYPIPNYDDLIRNGIFTKSDEVFLYELIKKRFKTINSKTQWRPVHGIHVSPNRKPNSTGMNWGMTKWKKEWGRFRNSKEFLGLEPTLTDYIKEKIQIIDEYYENSGL
jgi:hypothetical protein